MTILVYYNGREGSFRVPLATRIHETQYTLQFRRYNKDTANYDLIKELQKDDVVKMEVIP